jgi:hypothetical protein|tara:strand:- start:788 stop:949 length:162 start_codon:yes stop_codon:yes gene_type:complete
LLPGKLTTAYIDHFFVGVGLLPREKGDKADFSPIKTTAISDRNAKPKNKINFH